MLKQIADAFEHHDYQTAARLIKKLLKQEPNNPWTQLYLGRLQEVKGKLEAAERIYRQLLKGTPVPKIMAQARQGLARLEATAKEKRRQALAQATADPESNQLGVLVLKPISQEDKPKAAQHLARILGIDPYTARLQLPTRGWRLYRTGPVGELKYYGSLLREASIKCLWASVADIKTINIYQVKYFSDSSDQETTVVCHNSQGQLGSFSFNWSEVTQRVEGRLPLFEKVVDLDARRNLTRKTQTLDYAMVCDLHLPQRHSILRLCDRNYQFQQGIALTPKSVSRQNKQSQDSRLHQSTTRENWNNLTDYLNLRLLEKPLWSDFTTFAQTALDYQDLLEKLESHIDLFRLVETPWDPAFQLYSGLVFLDI
ncbi:tetratricopeptide repeat protein [Moorena producens]|uniref:tetratricopeptide repeat protein n=1 Tax=Moorena producens TaxID=1155739 RepID=UPI003C76F8BB